MNSGKRHKLKMIKGQNREYYKRNNSPIFKLNIKEIMNGRPQQNLLLSGRINQDPRFNFAV